MKKTNPKPLDYFVLIAGVIGICFASPLIKVARAHGASVFATAFWRILVGTSVVVFIGKPWKIRASWKSISLAILSGVLMALHFLAWVWSFDFVSVAVSVVLVTTTPVFMVILDFLILKIKPKSSTIFGIAVAMGGAIVVSLSGLSQGFGQITGSILALTGAILAASYLFTSKLAQKEMTSWEAISIIFSTSTILLLICIPFFGGDIVGFDSVGWIAVISMGILSQLIGHAALNISVVKLSTTITATSVLFEPVGASILAWFIIGEVVAPLVYLGGVVVIFGVWLTVRT